MPCPAARPDRDGGERQLLVRGRSRGGRVAAAPGAIFFVASTAANSAYMTASEIFPLEARSLTIALFCAISTAVGGIVAPWTLGRLVGGGQPWHVAGGYAATAILMVAAAGAELALGVDAQGQSLENVAEPLSS